jgi:hypothetical protein
MARPFFVFLTISLLLGACTQRLICPAYQSAFIYDKDQLRQKFSYFMEDSTPKILTASKNKYLIAEPMTYRAKLRSLQTVAMKPVNVHLPDSLAIKEGLMEEEVIPGEDGVVPGAELDLAARSVIDSTFIEDVPEDTTQTSIDSIYVISKDKEVRVLKYNYPDSMVYDEASGKYVPETPKYVVVDVRFNVEQDNYMWYLRNSVVLPDVRLSQIQQKADKEAAGKKPKNQKKKKGFLGFFKNLFKKKNKEVIDSTEIQAPAKPVDDFDYIDEEDTPQDSVKAEPPKEKKAPFSFLKKKKKTSPPTDEEPAEERPKKKKKEKQPKREEPIEEEPVEEEEEKVEKVEDSF